MPSEEEEEARVDGNPLGPIPSDEEGHEAWRKENLRIREARAKIVTQWINDAEEAGTLRLCPVRGRKSYTKRDGQVIVCDQICTYCHVTGPTPPTDMPSWLKTYGFCSTVCGKEAFKLYRTHGNVFPEV